MNEWQRFLVTGPFEVEVGGHMMRCRPTGNDIPVAFHVEAHRDPSTLLIKFRYLTGMDEPRQAVTFGTVSIEIGELSARVFQMELRGMRGVGARQLQQIITTVLTQLSGRTRLAGPQVNYEATRRGLATSESGNQNATPPWMVSALERLRGSDPQTAS